MWGSGLKLKAPVADPDDLPRLIGWFLDWAIDSRKWSRGYT